MPPPSDSSLDAVKGALYCALLSDTKKRSPEDLLSADEMALVVRDLANRQHIVCFIDQDRVVELGGEAIKSQDRTAQARAVGYYKKLCGLIGRYVGTSNLLDKEAERDTVEYGAEIAALKLLEEQVTAMFANPQAYHETVNPPPHNVRGEVLFGVARRIRLDVAEETEKQLEAGQWKDEDPASVRARETEIAEDRIATTRSILERVAGGVLSELEALHYNPDGQRPEQDKQLDDYRTDPEKDQSKRTPYFTTNRGVDYDYQRWAEDHQTRTLPQWRRLAYLSTIDDIQTQIGRVVERLEEAPAAAEARIKRKEALFAEASTLNTRPMPGEDASRVKGARRTVADDTSLTHG